MSTLKKIFDIGILIVIAILLIIKGVGYFVDYGPENHDLIMDAIFLCIGASYLVSPGWMTKNKKRRWIVQISGACVIILNFIAINDFLFALALIGIVLPQLIRYQEKRSIRKRLKNIQQHS